MLAFLQREVSITPIRTGRSTLGGVHSVVKKGKTPVLTAEEARQLLDSIDTCTPVGLRDRALISVMLFTFARVSAVVNMNVDDCYQIGKRTRIRLHEEGGKHHEVPPHHTAEEYLDAYLQVVPNYQVKTTPQFLTALSKTGSLSTNRLSRNDALRMIKRRAKKAGLSDRICCHTFRATGITAYRMFPPVLALASGAIRWPWSARHRLD